jgi:hypothetical protein
MSGGLGIALGQLIVPAAAGLLGVLVGGWMTGHNQKKERQHNRIREQLRDFYTPLLSIRYEIRSKSELRVKLHAMAHKAWRERTEHVQDDPVALRRVENARTPQFDKLFDYSDDQLRNDLIPKYREMLEHFKRYMWLAEPSTLKHFAALVEYVEIWNRFFAQTLPHEVLEEVDHREDKLTPFYEDLEKQENTLREELKK